MSIQSLKKRYIAKLSANFVGLAILLVITAIVPRGLGPKAYGDFNFLTNFFNQLLPIFVLGTSMGFYTKLSQRPKEFGLISFYFQFTGLALLALFLFVILSHLTSFSQILWIDIKISYVYKAVIYSSLLWLVGILFQVSDANGFTISTEIARIIQRVIGALLISLLYFESQLNLTNFFYYNYFITIILIVALLWIFYKKGLSFFQNWRVPKKQIKNYTIEFYKYSHPLLIYILFSVASDILSRWILQKYAGSVQQGFFGLSYQVGAICFLFTSAMTSLIIREFSIAFKNNNLTEMARLFRRYIPMLYAIAAVIGCFACVQAEKITFLFGGKQYENAILPMMVMALYPIHQTYGQLSGSVFYATNRTKQYRNIGIIMIMIGLPLTFWTLAPVERFGLNGGAVGLAIVMVAIQFVAVNIQLYYNSKFLKLNFIWYFKHQVFCLVLLGGMAVLSKVMVDRVIFLNSGIVINFVLAGFLYILMNILLVYFWPELYGLFKEDVNKIVSTFIGKIKKKLFNNL